MTRVIHTGDTHLGYRQYHSPERRRDFLEAFRRVARDAVDDDVDAVVHAGDLFHDRRPELPDLLGTLSVLRELDEAGIPFLAIVGNHETKRDAQWLDLFASLDLATRLGDEPVVVGDVALYGLDYVPASRRDDLDYAFDPHDAEFAALVAHGLFEPFDLGEWDAEAILETADVDFDAMLLGDNHKPGIKRADDGTWLTYSGSTERASADEREERGYNLVTFEDGEVTVARRGLPTREFVFVDVELDEGEGHARVHERVAQYDVEDAVAIVTIEGEGEPVAPADVEELLREAGALVARVNDRREIEAEAGGDRGLVRGPRRGGPRAGPRDGALPGGRDPRRGGPCEQGRRRERRGGGRTTGDRPARIGRRLGVRSRTQGAVGGGRPDPDRRRPDGRRRGRRRGGDRR